MNKHQRKWGLRAPGNLGSLPQPREPGVKLPSARLRLFLHLLRQLMLVAVAYGAGWLILQVLRSL